MGKMKEWGNLEFLRVTEGRFSVAGVFTVASTGEGRSRGVGGELRRCLLYFPRKRDDGRRTALCVK